MSIRYVLAQALVVSLLVPSLLAEDKTSWICLFNGRDFTGWRASENPASFKVEDGAIVAEGPRAHLFYIGKGEAAFFRDFELYCEVKLWPGANSGIYLHTAYQPSGWPKQGLEVQLNNSQPEHEGYYEFKKTGSLYGVRNVLKAMVPDLVWFAVRIRVQGNEVKVWLNDIKVVDYVADPRLDKEVISRMVGGTIALQAHDPTSRVAFRNIWLRPLDRSGQIEIDRRGAVVDGAIYTRLIRLYSQNYPIADLHTHARGGLTVDDILERFYRVGINYGVAVNCGYGFSITNDAGIYRWLEQMRGLPLFLGMQAEGREWMQLFTPDAVAQFDYVFTDAMTFIDRSGRRVRLWVDQEVRIDDPDAFMEEYVDQIIKIISTEPIDVYVNPTFLPKALADRYDQLWTLERMLRVIRAAAEHGVAIEINDRYKIPSAKFIKLAKEHGVKFTLGTNNSGRDDLGFVSYGLQMIEECGLKPDDFFVPGRQPTRAQRQLKKALPDHLSKCFVYVGTYTGGRSQGIYGYAIDGTRQTVEELGCLQKVRNPSFLVVNKSGTLLYAVSELYPQGGERGAGELHAYRIKRECGSLEWLGSISTGGLAPCHLCLSGDEQAVIVANYGDGTVGLIEVDRTGRPVRLLDVACHTGNGPNKKRQEGPHPHCTVLTPDGRYVLVADLGVDRIYAYRIETSQNGQKQLLRMSEADVLMPPGSGPRHIAFHPNGRFMYVVSELANSIAVYSYNPNEAVAFRFAQQISTLPVGFSGENTAAEVAVDPSGNWVLVSNRGHNSIAVMRILMDGTLVPWDYVHSGGSRPRHFAFSPDGEEVWIANQGSDLICVFRFDRSKGELSDSGRRLEVGSPACVVFVPAQ